MYTLIVYVHDYYILTGQFSVTDQLSRKLIYDCLECPINPVSYTHLDVYKRQIKQFVP